MLRDDLQTKRCSEETRVDLGLYLALAVRDGREQCQCIRLGSALQVAPVPRSRRVLRVAEMVPVVLMARRFKAYPILSC
jgi:hypothetical protein